MSDRDRERSLAEFKARLQALLLQAASKFGPEDVAAILLVQSMTIQNLHTDQALCAAWLRNLATEVEQCGTINSVDPKDLN